MKEVTGVVVCSASSMNLGPFTFGKQGLGLLRAYLTAPLELLHIDFTSIETAMELDQAPKHGEHFGLLQPLYKSCHGICDPQSNCEDCC